MQVVYSGGSTPTPSPRVQRKQYYGRPLLAPGYGQGTSTPPHLQHRCASKERKEPNSASDSSIRDCIPAMTKPAAIVCLVLNILLPGLGTFVAGLTVLCGSAIRFKYISKQKVVWSNTWVAFLQFITAFLFLLGWIWSIVWGAAFISIANEYAKKCQKPTPTPMSQGEAMMLRESENGMNVSLGFNRTSSTPGLSSTSQVHLNKPLMLRSSSADQPTQPTIVLQTVPPSSHSESSLIHKRIYNDSSQRHKRKLNVHTSEESCVSSSPGKSDRLEQIVLHNLPRAPGRRVRGVLRRDDTITSTTSTVSEEDMIM